ncbi:hypothetical protein VTJ83DRAFT_638 [Remersonia thermophila]|uniref:chitinase n=1 Tax=Remersonia thermophila TaxID=72144 RepID=A0ABR4DLP5_9PEZI
MVVTSSLAYLAAPLALLPGVWATPTSSQGPSGTSASLVSSSAPSSTPTTPPGNSTGFSGYRNALYYSNWSIYGANMQPQQIPADQVTHLLYAFADIGPDGEVKSSDSWSDTDKHYPGDSWSEPGLNAYGCVKQLYVLKKKHRRMKTLLSIGGWTYSPKFAPVAATKASRERFCNTAVTLLKDWGMDGLDIDWEYPTNAEQAKDFVLLLQTCRAALDSYAAKHASNYHFLLTIAAPAGPQHYNHLNFTAMDPFLDAWHIMTYDYAGSWDATSGHQANLFPSKSNPEATKFSTERAVNDYIARGVPRRKIVLGLPLYGRQFVGTAGPGHPYAGIGSDGSIPGQPGIWLYKDLPRPGATEHFDAEVGAAYSFSKATSKPGSTGTMVSYDTLTSAKRKVDYLLEKGLGGAVFWEAAGDKTGEESLVAAVKKGMGLPDQTQNWLSYPASRYTNIKMGMPGY